MCISANRTGIFKITFYILGDKEQLYLHCIGHSLGAHVCGQAGRKSQIFDRVTGLDPAGPGFENCTDHLNVDKDSALCVDNIHTDGTREGHWNPVVQHFGTLEAWGDIDFYPNGGGGQPGCIDNDVPPCSHHRAILLFIYTIQGGPNACPSKRSCTGQTDCDENAQEAMGYYSSCLKGQNLLPGSFFLDTAKKSPYC